MNLHERLQLNMMQNIAMVEDENSGIRLQTTKLDVLMIVNRRDSFGKFE